MVRLQKYLADAGVASRRASEKIIEEGRVSVNGEVVNRVGTSVDPERDSVVLDGKPLRERRRIYVALHKPHGVVCSRNDERGRPTIYELLPREWGHLHSVGRLDYATEGLLFLTNDGNFSLRLTHPRYGVIKKYRVIVEGRVEPDVLQRFTRGVWHEGEKLRAERAMLISASKSQSTVDLDLAEGKNREVRRMFDSQGLTVKRLQRLQIGKIKLGELRLGKWRTLTEAEIDSLLS